jgi:hypothetical protein
VPQYRVLYRDDTGWRRLDLDFRRTPFSLSGMGTKAIPIARPQLLVDQEGTTPSGLLLFRDSERGERVSVVRIDDFRAARWSVRDLTSWPSDPGSRATTPNWRRDGVLQPVRAAVRQVDGEGIAAAAPTEVQVLEWRRSDEQ